MKYKTSEWQNRELFLLFLFLLITSVGRYYYRIATKTKWQQNWIYYASIAYIFTKTRSSVLMKVIYGLLMMAMLVRPLWGQGSLQGTKPDSEKIASYVGRTLLLELPQ